TTLFRSINQNARVNFNAQCTSISEILFMPQSEYMSPVDVQFFGRIERIQSHRYASKFPVQHQYQLFPKKLFLDHGFRHPFLKDESYIHSIIFHQRINFIGLMRPEKITNRGIIIDNTAENIIQYEIIDTVDSGN